MSASTKPQAVPLSTVAAIDNRKSVGLKPYVGLEDISNNTGGFLGSREPRAVKSATFAFDGRHVLYGRLRAYLNKALTPDFEGHCSTEIFPILPSEKLDRRYLFYWLTSQPTCERISATSTGARMPRANMHEVMAFEIPLPPLDDQKRIVAVLDQAFVALDRARALAEANLADAEGFFASFIEAELEKSGGAVLTLQQMLDAGMILSHLDGNHGENYPRKEEFVDEGVPYVSANCIKDGQIDLKLAKFLSDDRASVFKKGVAQDGDIIFAHNATVGPVAILRTEEPKVILSTSVTYYRPSLESILPEFLMYEMRSSAFKKQYEAVMKQATRNQVPITAQRRLTHTIPDLPIQRQVIAAAIELEGKSRSLIDLYSRQISDINEVRASLLQKAFAGELT